MPSTRGRPRGFDRTAALDAAIRLFWERGYDTVGIQALTQAMGIAPASLYAAFTDKRTLFEEAVEVYADRYGGYIRESLDEEPTARAAVERLLRAAADRFTMPGHPPGCLILNGATNHAESSGEVAAALAERRAVVRTAIRERIDADIAAGLLPADTDAAALARYVSAVSLGMSLQARDGATRADLHRVVTTALCAWPR